MVPSTTTWPSTRAIPRSTPTRLRSLAIGVGTLLRYPNGLFAELSDPEGNRVQLWQPMSPE